MIHLGVHYGHNATIAVVKDGKLVFCQSEERFNRIKNSTGFPEETLQYIYENICPPSEVASATLFGESIFGYLFLKQHDFKPFQYGEYLSPEISSTGLFSRSEIRWKLSQWRARTLVEGNKRLQEEADNYFQ